MNRMAALPLLLVVPLSGCAGPAGTPDTEIGLSRGSVFEAPAPPAIADNVLDVGEASPRPRAYPGAPPVIPHGIGDFLPITRDENLCVDCHMVEEKTEGGPTPMPDSHYVDLRNSPAERRDTVAGARHVCVSCHASRTEAAPLVPSRFSAPAGEAGGT